MSKQEKDKTRRKTELYNQVQLNKLKNIQIAGKMKKINIKLKLKYNIVMECQIDHHFVL